LGAGTTIELKDAGDSEKICEVRAAVTFRRLSRTTTSDAFVRVASIGKAYHVLL